MTENFSIRKATKADCPIILQLIHAFKDYYTFTRIPSLTVKDLENDGFGLFPFFKAIIVEVKNTNGTKIAVGYALYYFAHTTINGRVRFLEDLFILKEYRRCGIGKALLNYVYKDSVLVDSCVRLDFPVHKENLASIQFFKKYGVVNRTEKYGDHLYVIKIANLMKIANDETIKGVGIVTTKKGSENISASIRRAEKKDSSIICSLLKWAIKNRNHDKISFVMDKEEFEKLLLFGEKLYSFRVLVAEDENELLLGFVIYSFGYSSDIGRSLRLEYIGLNGERPVNIAGRLLKAAVVDGLSYMCLTCELVISSGNQAAIKFFEKYGAFNVTLEHGWELYKISKSAMINIDSSKNE